MLQYLGLGAFTALAWVQSLGQGTKILQVMLYGQGGKKKKKSSRKECCSRCQMRKVFEEYVERGI